MTSRTAVAVLVAATLSAVALGIAVASPVAAIPGGRIDLQPEPTRTLDTRIGVGVPTPGKVTTVEVGSTHVGLGIDPDVWLTVAEAFAET